MIIICWGLVALLGCAAFAGLGLWATYTGQPETPAMAWARAQSPAQYAGRGQA